MDRDGMVEPFSEKYFPTEFVEHIAGRKVLHLSISGIKCHDEDKAEETWHHCNDIEQTIERGTLDKLRVCWRQRHWLCNLILDRRSDNGIWTIEHTKFDTGCNAEQLNIGIGINYDGELWLWFFARRPGNHTNIWWKCPTQIIAILAKHMGERRRRPRRSE